MNRRAVLAFVFSATICAVPSAAAQSYPSRPARVILGFGAGGASDIAARLTAAHLSEKFKQPFVVENRPGANGAIAAQAVIASPADGYTLLLGTSGALTVSQNTQKTLPYHPVNDLTPIALIAGFHYVLIVNPSLPVVSVAELISYAKSNPGKLSFGSVGIGSMNHIAGEWLKSVAGIQMEHVPYKSDPASTADVMAGRLQLAFNTVGIAMPQVRAGKVRGLAVTSEKRSRFAEGLPTMIEAGYRDFVAEPWNGLMGPAGLPQEIVRVLNAAVNEVLAKPEVLTRLADVQLYPVADTPEGFRRRIAEQTEKWREIVERAGIPKE